jgi:site-specific recombinase XerD
MTSGGKMTRREPLGIFLYGGETRRLTAAQKAHNRDTLEVAEIVRARRHLDVQAGAFGFLNDSADMQLCDYLLSRTKGKAKSTVDGWRRMAALVAESGANVPICKLDARHCIAVREFLIGKVSAGEWKQATASHHLAYFRSGLRRAYKEGLLRENLNERFDSIPMGPRAKIEYLTLDELTRLIRTPTKNPGIRPVVFFAAITGLRTSEIRELEWVGIKDMPDGSATMTYYQRKTKKSKTRPMPAQARKIIGQRGTGRVFPHIIAQDHLNEQLRRWASDAGIDKHLHMHCLRHTFATLHLDAGTPLPVISDMLDHSTVKTTEIYAEVMGGSVKQAAERIVIEGLV